MREPARVVLDEVSDHLAEVLRRADRLLAEWSAFGAKVRDQVDRESRTIGHAVARSVDDAVRGVADAAISAQLEKRLAALTAELGTLEQRSRAAVRALDAERTAGRRIGWLAVAGIAVANALLVLILLREPPVAAPPAIVPALQPVPADAAVPLAVPVDAPAVEIPRDAPPPVDAGAPPPVAPKPPPARRGTLPSRRP